MHSSPQDGGRIHIVFNPKASQRDPDWHTMPEHGLLQQIEQELDALVGMTQLKAFLRELYALFYIQSKRREAGISSDPHLLHMLFTGNPGTGKTTAARLALKRLMPEDFQLSGESEMW